ncbi:MAG: DegV family protein [Oscillospiraceae bacterium]|nr:DegV family protein [Oscillospiraceae bacterium]
MNENVRIITDSGCDISAEMEEQYKELLVILPFEIAINGKSYTDRKDLDINDFYRILKENDEIPKHSQITALRFEEKYRELYAEGVREIIVDVINAAGSQTYSSAVMAKEAVRTDCPDLKIYTIDSQTYTLGYGYPITEACRKLQEGQTVACVVAYLEDWAKHIEAFIIGFDLRHMKKSGRITAAASFLGELMGLKPIITLFAEKTEVVKKARGEKAAIEAAVEHIASRMTPETPWQVITTTRPEQEKEFIEKMTKRVGYGPSMIEPCGVVVSCNAGPDMIGVLVRGAERN